MLQPEQALAVISREYVHSAHRLEVEHDNR